MDYTRNTMRAAIKSLEAVITPTVEGTGESQAIEQVHLVTDFLRFAEQRIHLIADREVQQLRRAVELATNLDELLTGTSARDQLMRCRHEAERVAGDPQRSSESVRRATAELESAIHDATLAADDLDPRKCTQVRRAILASAMDQANVDRAWLLPLGFDPDPDSLPDLRDALADGRKAAS